MNEVMKKFNINDCFYVQITEEGWKHLRANNDPQYIRFAIENHKVEIEGEIYYKLQCYQAFDLMPISFGNKPLFKTTVLIDE